VCRQTLLNRVVVRLRALVILPNRDLALQVKSVFDLLCEGTDLKVSQPPFTLCPAGTSLLA
jgi:superfamily II DNA/RNA helicase